VKTYTDKAQTPNYKGSLHMLHSFIHYRPYTCIHMSRWNDGITSTWSSQKPRWGRCPRRAPTMRTEEFILMRYNKISKFCDTIQIARKKTNNHSNIIYSNLIDGTKLYCVNCKIITKTHAGLLEAQLTV
jgi:hypothetical protein